MGTAACARVARNPFGLRQRCGVIRTNDDQEVMESAETPRHEALITLT